MTNTPPTVGLLCLRDLDAPYAWSTWRGPAVLATQGLAPGDHAVVTLGPDAAHRYAVSLAKQTWRILGDVAAPLGGPEPAWQIFDADHTPVRRSTGHLLAGWHEHVVVLEHDALWREHLVTGAREPLCPAERTITAAIAVAGTPNAVLFDLSSAPPMVRLV